MKKLYIAAAALFATCSVFAQSQRTILSEEFTQASCGPCAAQNPAFNTLLQANTTKAVVLKYQTSWPGVDPMNAQTQNLGVGTRVTYYGVTGVPTAMMDGVQEAGSSYTGAPANWTQAAIDAEYAISSAFTMTTSHTFNATYDSVTISVNLTASQAVTTGTLVLQVAMVEKEIDFCAAPGSNGETVFYGVNRKMLPSGTGTSITNTWTVGQTQTWTFTSAVPAYIYDIKNFGVVAFVQDNASATKAVLQASISEPIPLPNYAILHNCSQLSPALICAANYTSDVTITNNGSANITSCTISYNIDGGTSSFYPWTGTLAPGAATTVTLPSIALSGNGAHTFTAKCTTVNGVTNIPSSYASITSAFTANLSGTLPPITQNFSAVTFPPAGWGRNNPDNDVTWSRNGLGNGNTGSAKMDYYDSPSGNIDDLFLPGVDMSTATSAVLTFDIAKGYFYGYTDRLDVVVSTDCGATWTSAWTKSDPALSTIHDSLTAYTVTNTSTWRNESVNLSSYIGQSNLIVGFRATSGYGNNAYLDNINLNVTVGIHENELAQQINLYPSPTSGEVFVNISAVKSNVVKVTITDITGKLISVNENTKNTGTLKLDLSTHENGTYLVQIDADGQRVIKKVILNK